VAGVGRIPHMKASWACALTAITALAISVSTTSATPGKPSEGKEIFLRYKCTSCHSIEAEGIVKIAAEADSADTTTAKHKPPDLSGVGMDKKAAWFAGFLLKKEMLEGRRHLLKFRGTDKDLSTLAAWLQTLKTPRKAKGDHAADGEKGGKSDSTGKGDVESGAKGDSTGTVPEAK